MYIFSYVIIYIYIYVNIHVIMYIYIYICTCFSRIVVFHLPLGYMWAFNQGDILEICWGYVLRI